MKDDFAITIYKRINSGDKETTIEVATTVSIDLIREYWGG